MQISDSNEQHVDDDEATTFAADAHLNFFREFFGCYDIDFDKWVICQTVDKASVNVRIGDLMSKPTIGCDNHLLN